MVFGSQPRESPQVTVNSSKLTERQRGLVPSIKYSNGIVNDEIITESAIVSQFLADTHPSHLLPASNDGPTAALTRARINFFVDTWFTKAGSYWFNILRKDTEEEKETLAREFIAVVEKEIEPLLKDADPYFGGSKTLTFAEVRLNLNCLVTHSIDIALRPLLHHSFYAYMRFRKTVGFCLNQSRMA
jgi:glutathione S-transferase